MGVEMEQKTEIDFKYNRLTIKTGIKNTQGKCNVSNKCLKFQD